MDGWMDGWIGRCRPDKMKGTDVEGRRTRSRGGRIYLKLCVTVTKQKDILKTRVTPDQMTLDMIEITTII
ncbi:unnamed protein product [Onchocerca flexuosa]|uniref:Uncharacterized protein n=1 Tax=Onchocerca flexuosa TaxID=387005 RepID=A0A183I4H5_9BILA|nr:unnamed protein product [Onchocerca flexuosa]